MKPECELDFGKEMAEREMRAPFPGRPVGAAAGGWGKGGGGSMEEAVRH